MPDTDFDSLYKTRLNFQDKDAWDAYYQQLVPYLDHADPTIRKNTLERLCTAVYWAEGGGPRKNRPPTAQIQARTDWLLGQFLASQEKHTDTWPFVLEIMRYKFPRASFSAATLALLADLMAAPPKGVRADVVHGTILLNQPIVESQKRDIFRHWIDLLDDPSNYVRACAAFHIGGQSDEFEMPLMELFAFIKQKDIARPGIAGAFWTDAQYSLTDQNDFAMEWMMSILEARTTPAPTDTPFNDIEFHLHEICDHSPDMVRRMLDGGHKGLAVETALETHGVVAGMAPILRELGHDENAGIAHCVIRHLAYFYQEVHPNAAADTVRRTTGWCDDADLFLIRFFPNSAHFDCAVIYCKRTDGYFDNVTAWAMIDRILPSSARGFLRSGFLTTDKSLPPGPEILGNRCTFYYENHKSVALHGDPAQQKWSRIVVRCKNGFGPQH